MLNERQKLIIKDLESTKVPITATALSKKYEVSLRTMRNDIQCIAEELQDVDCIFQRIPHVGMQIISKHKVVEHMNHDTIDYLSLDGRQREHLILLCFLLKPNPITIEYLSTLFLVSKGTMMNDIKAVQKHESSHEIKLQGVRNKGYFLEGNSKHMIRMINSIMDTTRLELLRYYFIDQISCYSNTDIEQLKETMHYIDAYLLWKIENRERFFVWLAIYMKYYQNIGQQDVVNYKKNKESAKVQQLIIYLEYHFQIVLDQIAVTALKYILSLHTDFTEDMNDVKISEDLSLAVDKLLKKMIELEPAVLDDVDNLHNDIVRHLLCSVNRRSLNLDNHNPLIHKIKVRYPEIWKQVEIAKRAFEQVYPMILNEHEIGFLTLYFARSLEKCEKIKEARVLVVCNTGRGVSKLLVTRIMNHLPEIHIVAMQSYLSLHENAELLRQIDFIITTIPLPEINKPYVVVSPFLTEVELVKVKEAVWISCQEYAHLYQNDMNGLVDSIVNKYVDDQQAVKLTGEIHDLMGSNKATHFNTSFIDSELYAQIAVEVIAFIKQIFEYANKSCSYEILSGIMAHVIMSVPRWEKGDFIKVTDFAELKALYPREFQDVLHFTEKIEKILDVFIDQNEIIAILRYLLI